MNKGALLAIAMLAGSISASATPIVYYTGWQSTTTGVVNANGTRTLTLTKFDSGLGTLAEVQFYATSSAAAGYTITNASSGTLIYNFNLAVNGALRNPVNVAQNLLTTSASITDTQTIGPNATYSTPNYFPAGTRQFPLLGSASAGSIGSPIVFNTSALLNYFNGAASPTPPGTTTLSLVGTIANNSTADQNVSGGGVSSRNNTTVYIRYGYTVPESAIPEPASMALAGAAMLFGGIFLRRRTR